MNDTLKEDGMLKFLSLLLVISWLVLVPTGAAQQRAPQRAPAPAAAMPEHEIGFDLAAAYTKPSSTSGGLEMLFPVDGRVTFLTRSKIKWEGRLALTFNTIGTTTYTIDPDVNVVYQLRPGTGPYNLLRAPYLTGGAGFNFANNGVTSGTQFSLNGGLGTRVPFESAAMRYEGFLSYTFKGASLPSTFAIGIRIGISFWH
jgi:hypothetical protein